jgi:hypothetical protein
MHEAQRADEPVQHGIGVLQAVDLGEEQAVEY